MGEDDENAHLDPAGLGMSGMENNTMNNNGTGFNNGSISGPMNGPMASTVNNGDDTPISDGRNNFTMSNSNGLDGVNQGS